MMDKFQVFLTDLDMSLLLDAVIRSRHYLSVAQFQCLHDAYNCLAHGIPVVLRRSQKGPIYVGERGRGKYPPLIDGKLWLQYGEEEEDDNKNE